jgi:hypothetical protein
MEKNIIEVAEFCNAYRSTDHEGICHTEDCPWYRGITLVEECMDSFVVSIRDDINNNNGDDIIKNLNCIHITDAETALKYIEMPVLVIEHDDENMSEPHWIIYDIVSVEKNNHSELMFTVLECNTDDSYQSDNCDFYAPKFAVNN